ncbi:MAG: polymer-forming cytoskeletal protein [Betaproteobacteria bacterium]|nr:polymer-forming cytoskeletal protein [Betaproteobacteria bacterium]NBY05698.1 polymer-forming cytoskeletal protein [Betaproteobacteria bacterium]
MATSFSNDLPSLTIGSGVTAKGILNVPGKATINGTIEGELTADEVLVGETGKFNGKLKARRVEVFGKLGQVIDCQESLIIRQSGKVNGRLDYAEIEIDKGGEFVGQLNKRK